MHVHTPSMHMHSLSVCVHMIVPFFSKNKFIFSINNSQVKILQNCA